MGHRTRDRRYYVAPRVRVFRGCARNHQRVPLQATDGSGYLLIVVLRVKSAAKNNTVVHARVLHGFNQPYVVIVVRNRVAKILIT